ncbi:MAG: HAMP domain-containing histidine kinase [Actinobacteria bacterium]|nr:HAMP domain-containing histidine kinase [Actinomycetota bacterium]
MDQVYRRLLADRLPPDERALLGDARRNVERLGLLIDDLLAVNQLESGAMSLERGPLDLRTVAISAVSSVQSLIREKGQALEADLPEPLPGEGDPRRLEQALVNLLANAHQHTASGTRIAVSTTGMSSTSRWRTATSRLGRCHRSSAPIHQSSDQPSNHGVRSPRGSTIASLDEPRLPTIVQLRLVTLASSGRCPRGVNAGERGSSWRSSQCGHTQSTPSCAAARVRTARNTVRAPTGSNSPGSCTSRVSPSRWKVER